jgi:hypothetical protein
VEKNRVTIETWLLRRIEKKDAIVGLALGDAEEMAIAAVRAFENVTAPPFEVKEEAEAVKEQRASRPPKVVNMGYDEPAEEAS